MWSRLTTCLLLLASAGCVERVEIDHSPCPCPEGWSCQGGVCVRPGPGQDGAVGDDSLVPDSVATPSGHTITFEMAQKSRFLYTISTDGSGLSKVSDFNEFIVHNTKLAGRLQEAFAVSTDVPRQEVWINSRWVIRLPGKKGILHRWKDGQSLGMLLVPPDGRGHVIFRGTGTYSSYTDYHAVTRDGGRVVGIFNDKAVLMRTDGINFPGGKPWVVLGYDAASGSSWGPVYPGAMAVTSDHLYVVAMDKNQPGAPAGLWRAPLDGSQALLTRVLLPKVIGRAPQGCIGKDPSTSDDGDVVIIRLDCSAISEVVAVAGGKVTNLSNSPANYTHREDSWGRGDSRAQRDVSPKGTFAAYVWAATPTLDHLFVTRTDGSAKPVQVTAPDSVIAPKSQIRGVKFLDEDNLVMVIHQGTDTAADVFRYHLPSKTLHNVSGSGSTTRPFDLSGQITVAGMWPSPNGKYLYYLSAPGTKDVLEIVAVNRSTWKTKLIIKMTQSNNQTKPFTFAACPGSSTLYFQANPPPNSQKKGELYSFDMDTATTATHHDLGSEIVGMMAKRGITSAPDCRHVAVRNQSAPDENIYLYRPEGPVTNVTKGLGYCKGNTTPLVFSADSSLLGFQWSSGLYVAPVKKPGPRIPLYPKDVLLVHGID